MNFIQAYYKLPLAIVFKEDKAEYYTALQETRKWENIQVFQSFMLQKYKKHLEQEITSFTRAMSQEKFDEERKWVVIILLNTSGM